jgi:hypothetical protein
MLGEVTQIVLAAIGSTGLVLFIGRFVLKNIVEKGVDHLLAERLEETRATHAKELAALTSKLKSDADDRLASLTTDLKSRADSRLEEERARYAASLESLKATLLSDANKELERIRSSYVLHQDAKKADLNVEVQETLEMFKIRREKYPPLVECAYRIRNKARESLKEATADTTQDLKKLVAQFTEMMYQLSAFLDKDNLHLTVHSFKNTALAVSNHLANRVTFLEQNKQADATEATAAAETHYLRLDEQYSQVKEAFRAFISAKPHMGSNASSPEPSTLA